MKVRKVKLPVPILLVFVLSVICLFVGYKTGIDSKPTNCAELGGAYLEIGKKELGINDFGSQEWLQLIEDETKFTKDYYKSLSK
ncbi:MAG: hypothetical protein H6773_02855 [Pseudomonadales bacterium]|uniref:Uncharacterized protein n=1 Tax=Candidatus Dojkabacteria bacterium TaxID=2099670 RepID=A0A955RI10_9BACT|nr:hypothetical protein [Candidatus Woesebacteria bacterium]MCA9382317.1 hypothetical protein [Candidatus Dojkabacteria bacterium]MCB9801096.1 hypothetical protein [Pseudomonadales bacterium]